MRADRFYHKDGAHIRGETLTTVVVFVEVSRPEGQKSFYAAAYSLLFILIFFKNVNL